MDPEKIRKQEKKKRPGYLQLSFREAIIVSGDIAVTEILTNPSSLRLQLIQIMLLCYGSMK